MTRSIQTGAAARPDDRLAGTPATGSASRAGRTTTAAPVDPATGRPRRRGERAGQAASRTPGRGSRAVAPARLSPTEVAQRVPFVLVVMGLIAGGVGGTLWLSAVSTEETYALQQAREENVKLSEDRSALEAVNERARSAEELATRAQSLGMIGVDSAPIVVVGADGKVTTVGEKEPKFGAPIAPLQGAPGASTPGTSETIAGATAGAAPTPAAGRPRGQFAPPPPQQAQDQSPRGLGAAPAPAPAPQPPVAQPPSAQAPAVDPAVNAAPAPAPVAFAPAPRESAPSGRPGMAPSSGNTAPR